MCAGITPGRAGGHIANRGSGARLASITWSGWTLWTMECPRARRRAHRSVGGSVDCLIITRKWAHITTVVPLAAPHPPVNLHFEWGWHPVRGVYSCPVVVGRMYPRVTEAPVHIWAISRRGAADTVQRPTIAQCMHTTVPRARFGCALAHGGSKVCCKSITWSVWSI